MTAAPRPVAAVLAVVIRGEEVLLVRRANPPDQGLWGFPGGKIETGETLLAAAERELLEETGVTCEAIAAFAALDAFHHEDGRLRAHYVMVAVACRWIEGAPVAADDALEATWAPLSGLSGRADHSVDVDTVAEAALRVLG